MAKKFKRLRNSSSEAVDESPNKRVINGGGDSLEDNGNKDKHHSSSDDYDENDQVEDAEQQAVVDDLRRINRQSNRQSYLSTGGYSSEGGLSEEGNTTEPDTTPSQPSREMLSSLELSKCSSDGLSDRENVVRRIKCQVKQHINAAAGEHRLQPPIDCESTSDSDGGVGCDAITSVKSSGKPEIEAW